MPPGLARRRMRRRWPARATGAAVPSGRRPTTAGTVVWFRQDGADVVVRVEVGGAAAEARATLRVEADPP